MDPLYLSFDSPESKKRGPMAPTFKFKSIPYNYKIGLKLSAETKS